VTQLILYLDPKSTLSLQAQIRAALIDAITGGQLPPGERLPSTRQLARQLGVSRNTVIASVQELIADDFLISRERSGCYVNEEAFAKELVAAAPVKQSSSINWAERIVVDIEEPDTTSANWRRYPYPFISGQIDESLFPISEWRECDRIAQGVREIREWSGDSGLTDDALLVEQIRTRLLPARGISVQADEILVTSGGQEALSLVGQLLGGDDIKVGIESPGYTAARSIFRTQGAQVVPMLVDESGMCPTRETSQCDIVYVTPSHQYPTGVTMSMARRSSLLETADAEDIIVIEDDCTSETNYQGPNSPALKGMDTAGRVVYVSSLSSVLGPGVRVGYMVGSPELINKARHLRRLRSLQPSGYAQRMAGLFLSLGHHDAVTRRQNQVYAGRWEELRQAVNYCFPQPHFMITQIKGGTACWIRGPEGLNVRELAERAEERGILLEHPDGYLDDIEISNSFRLSINCIDIDRIRPGLDELAKLIKEMLEGYRETLATVTAEVLTEDQIHDVMPGSALIGTTAYGDPYTVRIMAGGKLDIVYDNVAQDHDHGRWWVEDGLWWRQFTTSTYGEARGFNVVLEDDVVKWFDADGDLVDTEVFIRNYQRHQQDTDS
jgi:GntR family transcriptional regulator/MocR family aminotransferase